MHDAVSFELNGKPAVAVIEDVFQILADAKKKLMGLPSFEPIIVEHPIGSEAGAAAKGTAIADRAVKWLTEGR
jgi:hypothetical protein